MFSKVGVSGIHVESGHNEINHGTEWGGRSVSRERCGSVNILARHSVVQGMICRDVVMREVNACAKNATSVALLRSCCNHVAFHLAKAEEVGSHCRVTRVDMRAVSAGACGNRGFRFWMWHEFKYEVVGGGACRLLRWLSRDAVTGGFVGEVGLARGYSEV